MKMQRSRTMLVALVVGASICSGANARDSALDTRSILRTEAALCAAFESGDADTLRNDLDRFFTLTDSKGVLSNRAGNIEEVTAREPVYTVFRNHDQKVRLYGDAAIVTGITTARGHAAGGAAFAGDYAYTDTWVHVDGSWKLAASHASVLQTR